MAKKLETAPRVLVVDDEPDLLTLMQLTLTKLGLEVVTADCRESALAALDRQTYSLCLTDMQLGDGTGLDVLAAIAERGLDLPCAVITAFGNADNAVAALKAGAFAGNRDEYAAADKTSAIADAKARAGSGGRPGHAAGGPGPAGQ